MPTVLDSLILEFNLDTDNFTREQQKIIDQIRKMQDEVRTRAIDIESSAKRITSVFSNLQRGALAVVGGFFGAEVFKTIDNMARFEANIGRVSQSIGLSAANTLAWANAFKAVGGSAEEGLGALRKTTQDILSARYEGARTQIGDVFAALGGPGFNVVNMLRGGTGEGGTMTAPEAWLALSRRLDEMEAAGQMGKEQRGYWLRRAGVPEFLLQGGTNALIKLVEEMKKQAPLAEDETKRAQQFVKDMAVLDTAFQHLAMVVTNLATGPLAALMEFLAQWLGGFNRQGAGVNFWDWMTKGDEAIREAGRRAQAPGSAGGVSAGTWGGGGVGGGYTETTPIPPIPANEQADIANMIIEKSRKYGLDPNVMLRVWSSEGRGGYVGDQGTSFGPFQLHYGSGASAGLGNVFTAMTGLDARDPKTIPAQIEFTMQHAAKYGLRPWHGWHGSPTAGGAGRGTGAPVGNQHVSFNVQTMNVNGSNAKEVAADLGNQVQRMKTAFLGNSALG